MENLRLEEPEKRTPLQGEPSSQTPAQGAETQMKVSPQVPSLLPGPWSVRPSLIPALKG